MSREQKRELLSSLSELGSVGATVELGVDPQGGLLVRVTSRRQHVAITERLDVGHSDADVIGFFARAARRVP